MQTARRIAKNTGFLYARTGITMFLSLYTTKLVLSALGISDFGLYNVVAGTIALLGFLNASMSIATQRFINYSEGQGELEQVKKIFNISVIIHRYLGLIIFVCLEISGFFFFHGILKIPASRQNAAQIIYQFSIASTILSVISVPYDAVINAHEHMLLYAILGVAESAGKLSIAFCIIYHSGDRLILYGLLSVILSVLLLLFRRFYCRAKYTECELNQSKYYDKPLMKNMLSFGSWNLLGVSGSMISNYGQGILLNIFFGTIVNAAQGIAGQVSGQLNVIAVNMLKALNPSIDKNEGAGNRLKMQTTAMFGSKMSFLLLSAVYIPFMTCMPFIFKIWLKQVPPYLITFCTLLLLRNLLEQMFIPLTSTILAVGNIKKFHLISAVLAILPLIITYISFKLNSGPGALYLIYLLYTVAASANILFFSYKVAELSIRQFLYNIFLRCLICYALSMYVTHFSLLLSTDKIIQLILACLITAITYPVIVWFIGFDNNEKILIKNFISSFLQKKIKLKASL